MSLVTLAEIKGYRGITGTEHDEELTRLSQVVQASLEVMVGRKFDRKSNQVDLFSPNGLRADVLLSRPPVRAIASVHMDATRVFAAGSLVASSSYVLVDAEAGIVVFTGSPPSEGIQTLRVEYDGGFLVNDPEVGPVKQIIIEQVWALREKGVNNLIGVRSRSVADGSVQYVNLELSQDQERMLSRYRLDVAH